MTCHHWEGLGSFRDEFPVSEDDVGGDGTAHDGDLKEGVAKGPPGADADIQDTLPSYDLIESTSSILTVTC